MPVRRAVAVMLSLIALPVACGAADDGFDPPAGYYSSATGTGVALKNQLHNIIDNHSFRSYDQARVDLQDLDEDPDDPNNIILIYSGQSIPSQWTSGATWNREHTWPRSRGVGSSGHDNSDLHMLRPCNPSVNSSRGNEPFGDSSSAYWDPGLFGVSQDRGEMARTMFYAAVRYDGSDSSTTDLELSNGFPSGNNMGDLADLLEWHFANLPDTPERRRNDRIGDLYQFNRNPFVDRPEFAWAVFGPGNNDSQISVGSPLANGSSNATIELGEVIGGGALSGSVSVFKTGSTPTTYTVTAGSGVTSSFDDGLARAFTSGNGSALIDFGFSAAGLGAVSGTITIDNTDLTTAGIGQGSADGDDVITLSASVLDVAAPSWNPSSSQFTLNFEADVEIGDLPATIEIPVYNRVGSFDRADLVLDGLMSSSADAELSLDASGSVETGVPGSVQLLVASSATLGQLGGTFVIDTREQSLPGATNPPNLTLNVAVQIVSDAVPGDVDGDGQTDVADITFVVSNLGAGALGAIGTPGDADGDGQTDVADITFVVSNLGAGV
ncbi:MAG: endonuclease [Planctomycetota bacterium]